MLLRFYLVSCAFVLCFFALAVLYRNRDLIVRSTTLFALTQLITLALWGGPIWFGILVGLLFFLGANEVFRHFQFPVVQRVWVMALGLGVIWLAVSPGWVHYAVLPVFIFVTLGSFWAPDAWVRNRFFTAGLVTCVIGYGAGFLMHLDFPSSGPLLAFLVLLQCNDAFGYLVGRMIGKTKVFPVLSPRKSVEGYFGGAVGVAIGMTLLVSVIHAIPMSRFGLAGLVMIGLVAWVIGNIGDLLFSSIKRRVRIKDFSHILPGHGGILDRFDNIFFGPSLFYLAWHAFMH